VHGPAEIGSSPPSAPLFLLPSIITKLTPDEPALDSTVRETMTARLHLLELTEGRMTLPLCPARVSVVTDRKLALFDEKFIAGRPKADRPDSRSPAVPRLNEMKLLCLREGHCFRDQACRLRLWQFRKPRAEGLDASSLYQLVQMRLRVSASRWIPKWRVALERGSAHGGGHAFPAPEPTRVWDDLDAKRTSRGESKLSGIADSIARPDRTDQCFILVLAQLARQRARGSPLAGNLAFVVRG